MKLSQFKFKLPEERIAMYPTRYRDESRLMVVHKSTGDIEHVMFKDILNYFDDKDVFIFNDTKVFPARLYGNKEKTGARIEVFLLRELNEEFRLWDVLVDPARKIRIGNKLYFGDDDSMVAEVIDNTTSRGRTLRFLYDGPHDEFKKVLYSLGEAPLPPYIKREDSFSDESRYQTVYARTPGSVAAPTAGLHFTKELMDQVRGMGIPIYEVTLHVGAGTFLPVRTENIEEHHMHTEHYEISSETANALNEAKKAGKRIVAVGTTSVRTLESASDENGMLTRLYGDTDIFIKPGYRFRFIDDLLTNFHTPESTLLMLVSALAGKDEIFSAYKHAIAERYRFFSYGDAMFIRG